MTDVKFKIKRDNNEVQNDVIYVPLTALQIQCLMYDIDHITAGTKEEVKEAKELFKEALEQWNSIYVK